MFKQLCKHHLYRQSIFTPKTYNHASADDNLRKKLCWGMENLLPDLPEGEDDTPYSRYQQDLNEQHNLRKESRDKSVISILMNKTFAHRRHLLVKEFVHLKNLIADYPLLCCQEQVQSLCLFVCTCPKDENALAFDGSFLLQVF